MGHGGSGDRGRIDESDQFIDAAYGNRAEFFGKLAGMVLIRIINRDEIRRFQPRIDTGMISSDRSNSDDSYFYIHKLVCYASN